MSNYALHYILSEEKNKHSNDLLSMSVCVFITVPNFFLWHIPLFETRIGRRKQHPNGQYNRGFASLDLRSISSNPRDRPDVFTRGIVQLTIYSSVLVLARTEDDMCLIAGIVQVTHYCLLMNVYLLGNY